MIRPGETAPDFTAATDAGDELTLSSLRGSKVVLYFYPKDNTPGCDAGGVRLPRCVVRFGR